MTLGAAAEATRARLLQGDAAARFAGLSIDSRRVEPGQAFVAIAGERFDGHDYCGRAAAAGAALLVVSRPPAEPPPPGCGVLLADDTRRALGRLGRAWRRQVAPRTVAVTGSVGKTTTKELLRNVLAAEGPTHSTPGNYNNDIGLPLTLLSMPADTRNLVLEMGMNHAGEIAALARLGEPEVGAITCLAPVHLEGLGSMEAIAAAKAELLEALDPARGAAVVPDEEPLLDPWVGRRGADPRRVGARVLRCGRRPGCEGRLVSRASLGPGGSLLRLELGGEAVEVRLPLSGAHNAENALTAATAALALGVPAARIARGLGRTPELSHRSSVQEVGGLRVYDDCYNANPVAMAAALETLVELARAEPAGAGPGEKRAPLVAVLGAMLELGPEERRYHREVGAAAAAAGLDLLVTVGELGGEIARGAVDAGMDPATVERVAQAAQASEVVARRGGQGAWVLVKASRGAQLEAVITHLADRTDP